MCESLQCVPFILAGLGVGLGILPPEGRDLILAGAILSILINPFLFTAVERGRVQLAPHPATSLALQPDHPPPPAPLPVMALRNHDVIVGYRRVGSLLGRRLADAGRQLVVFDETDAMTQAAQRDGAEVVTGNAADPEVLVAANLALEIVARAHTDDEVEYLTRLGADLTVRGEREIAHRMALVKAKLVHHGGVLFASAGFLMTTNEATTNSRVLASS